MSPETAQRKTEFVDVSPEGRMRLNFHRGQWRAWKSEKRFIVVLSGTQSGKTSYGPHWLFREIQRRGPGDYLAVSPMFPLLSKKMLPEFLRLFQSQLGLGTYNTQQKLFTFSTDGQARTHGTVSATPTQVYFGHAQDPESLESATAKAAWLDEAGQKKFRLGSWEAILRRLSIHQGRALITTTPYDLGWLKQKLWDPWIAAGKDHPEIDVIRFDSTENPAFPREEFLRAKADLPRWKFDLFYRAIFTRPAGLIYDSFRPEDHVVKRFRIPQEWQRFVGLDFGPVNTAAIFFAEEKNDHGQATGRYFAYREYHPGKRDPKEHVKAILTGEPRIPRCTGGSSSEGEWRAQFASAGLPVMEPPIRDVEVGIDKVYAFHSRDKILVFDDLANYLEQKATYSRELNDAGEVTEKIEDKSTYHILDAERYIVSKLAHGMAAGTWRLESY